jgi:hypothetical protein
VFLVQPSTVFLNEHFKHDLRGNGLLIVFPITLWDLLEERDDEIEDSSPK